RLGRGANPGTCPQGDRRAGMAVWWKSRSPIPLFKDPLRKFFMRQPCAKYERDLTSAANKV
ncbi:MAG: hypothetical protein SOW92_05855, partial [Kiritimatiellia bacterium]|nr:hypothetical protein [Kiritimatiellia bacterium]